MCPSLEITYTLQFIMPLLSRIHHQQGNTEIIIFILEMQKLSWEKTRDVQGDSS